MSKCYEGSLVQEDGYEPWHASLAEGAVRLTRCQACRRWQWYPLMACPACGNSTWDWEEVGTTGVLHSWTRVLHPTVRRPGLEPPYVIGLIELPQAGGARIVALAADEREPVIGSEVRLEIRQIADDSVLFFA
jgi:uncharacterized protein